MGFQPRIRCFKSCESLRRILTAIYRTLICTLLGLLVGCNDDAYSIPAVSREHLETAAQSLINSLPKTVGCLEQIPGGTNGPVLFRRWELHIENLSHQIQLRSEGCLEPRLKISANGFCRHFGTPPESSPDLLFLHRDSALDSEIVIDFDWVWGDKIDWGPEHFRDVSPLDYHVAIIEDKITPLAEYRWDSLIDNWVPISEQGERLWPFTSFENSRSDDEFYTPRPSMRTKWRSEWQRWFGRKKPTKS